MPVKCNEHLHILSPGQLCLWTVRTTDFDDSVTAFRLQPIRSERGR